MVNTRCFGRFANNSQPIQIQKDPAHIFETFINKNIIHNLTRFLVALFELEILQDSTTAFLLKIII